MDTYAPKGNICGFIIPDFIRRRPISAQAKFLYGLLCDYAREKDHCWPSHARLADDIGCSASSVKNYLAELVKERLIHISRSFYHANVYYLLRPAEIEERQVSRQSESIRPQTKSDSPQTKSGYIRNVKNQEEKINSPLPPSSHPSSSSPVHHVGGRNSSSEDFEKFWAMFPKKLSKGFALSTWNKLKRFGLLPSLDVLCAALRKFIESVQWHRENGRFIPLLANWLRGHCWQDDPTAPVTFQTPEQPKDVVFQKALDTKIQQEQRENEERKLYLESIRPEFEAFAAKFPTGSNHPAHLGKWSNLHKEGIAPTANDVPSDNKLNIVDFMNHFRAKHSPSKPEPFPVSSRNFPDHSRIFPACGTLFTPPQRAVA